MRTRSLQVQAAACLFTAALFLPLSGKAAPCPINTCSYAPSSCENKPSGFPLAPPWPVNSTFEIINGYWGGVWHCSSDFYALDFNMPSGTGVYPAAPGTIRYTENPQNPPTGYGKYVLIDHQNGYQTLYAHLSWLDPTLAQGTYVKTTKLIGYSGMTGTTTPHLHFTLYKGASWAGDWRAVPILPETFAGCYKNGNASSTCRALGLGDDLTRSQKCGNHCAQCILTVRNDLLPFYKSNGWDTSCGNYNSIVKNFCGPGVAPLDCDFLAKTSCKPACTDYSCGNQCTKCILARRTDILPFYQQNGWNTSCANRDGIVANYCSLNADTEANCRDLKRNACAMFCDFVP